MEIKWVVRIVFHMVLKQSILIRINTREFGKNTGKPNGKNKKSVSF